MRTDKSIRRMLTFVAPPNGKFFTLLAMMFKGAAANGNSLIIEYMKQTIIYPSTTGERFEVRGGQGKTKCLITQQHFGRCADKPAVLQLFEI